MKGIQFSYCALVTDVGEESSSTLGRIVRVESDSIYVEWDEAKPSDGDTSTQRQEESTEPQRFELACVGRSKQVVVVQDASGDIITFPSKQVEVLLDPQSRLGGALAAGGDGLRIMDGRSVLRADEWHGGPISGDAKVYNNPFFAQFVANGGDEAVLRKYRLKLHVLAKYGTDDGAMIGYHEAAFRMLLSLTSSEDPVTQRAACSALGKLARPAKEGEVWKKSAYRDRIVSGDGLLALLQASRSEVGDICRSASEALIRLVPDMNTLLSLLPKVLSSDERNENPLLSSWVAFTFFRLLAHRHRGSPISRVVKLPLGDNVPREPYFHALNGRGVTQDVRFPGACRLSIRMLPGSELNDGDGREDSLGLYRDQERSQQVAVLRAKQMELRDTYEAANSEALFLQFTCASGGGVATKGKKSNVAPGVVLGNTSALGYVCEVVADYPQAEVACGVPRPYSPSDPLELRQAVKISFDYAEKIHIAFTPDSCTDWSGEWLAMDHPLDILWQVLNL